ncbi:DUF1592 domain-containing protein [Lentisphaera marina]|uniref:DUF1592 domain-containing protein n=1 Tax=Lentisphaera marina TaxID=1111041 RepID=UPI0023657E8F|nr:DUF1592 domain-containing protein [Lentisphaera marina]MDD7985070.1 DUF1592 domain-containing protein [Lentisphaera marina]
MKVFIIVAVLMAHYSLAVPDQEMRALFKSYCYECHSNKKVKGKLNLETFSFDKDDPKLEDIWESVRHEEMPPEDEKPLPEHDRKKLLNYVEGLLSQKAEDVTPMRRLTRYEYDNSIRDIFALEKNIFAMPSRFIKEDTKKPYFVPKSKKMPDKILIGSRLTQLGLEKPPYGVAPLPVDYKEENGYDNNVEMLSFTPKLMSRYMDLAKELLNNKKFKDASPVWKEHFVFNSQKGDELKQAEAFLSDFLVKAFRKPLSDAQLKRYVGYFTERHKFHQSSYTAAMTDVVSVILASPDFLYKKPNENKNYSIASKLSYFLWGSGPDDRLLSLAADGKLVEEEVIKQEVERMLNDRKTKHLTYGFAAQWLHLGNLLAFSPDPENFPDYFLDRHKQNNIGQYLILEPLLLFETILVEDRSIFDFIDNDYSYFNNTLADYYKIDQENNNPDGEPDKKIKKTWRKVKINKNESRMGLITMGACLSLTSHSKRSAPILRGAWFANVIYNDPPPPPPANVPSLDEESKDVKGLTIREQLRIHSENDNCKICHAKIDPMGFTLESFDAVGIWREKYANGRDVDTSGKIFGESYTTLPDFKEIMIDNKEVFAEAFVKHLYAYALARSVGYNEQDDIKKILAASKSNGHKMRDVLLEIALSETFLRQ